MSNMINSQPRFGYEENNGVERVFDYATSRYTAVTDDDTVVESVDGEWHGRTLINLIKTQQPVESARRAKASDRATPDENTDPEGYANRRRIEQLQKDADERAERERVQSKQPEDKVEQFKQDFVGDGISQQEHDVNTTAQQVREGASQEGQQQIEAERQQREEERRQREQAATAEQPQS